MKMDHSDLHALHDLHGEPNNLFSFIVPVRNDARRLRRCLETIRDTSAHLRCEILVIDNGSTDGSDAVGREAGARVIVQPHDRVAVLRNSAAQIATGEFLAFVDADHELAPGWAAAALALLAGDDRIGAVGAQYHAPADGTWVQKMYDNFRHHDRGPRAVDWLPSGNLVVRRSAFDAVSGFDTALVTCEDVDLCQRLRAAGWTLVESDELRSVHLGDPATLRALFLGELWRGRDNLRVSLRQPFSLRSLPGTAFPVAMLAALIALAAGLLAWPVMGWPLAAGAALLLLGLLAVRTISLLRQAQRTQRGDGSLILDAVLVGGVYDVARACALVSSGSHDGRRRSERPR
jgi:GT2 family glycosyltransferase